MSITIYVISIETLDTIKMMVSNESYTGEEKSFREGDKPILVQKFKIEKMKLEEALKNGQKLILQHSSKGPITIEWNKMDYMFINFTNDDPNSNVKLLSIITYFEKKMKLDENVLPIMYVEVTTSIWRRNV